MALIKCPECGKEISDEATSCPNCGHPMRKMEASAPPLNQPKKKKHGCLIAVLVFVVIAFAGWFAAIMGTANNGQSPENTNGQTSTVKSENTEAETSDTVGFGSEGKLGNLSMIVNDVTETDSISAANGMMKYTPKSGKYAVVNVTIKNNSKDSQQLLLNYFKLIGPDDAKYTATIIPVADDKFITVDSVNPNLDITGNIVFEIPNDLGVADFKLQYSDFDIFSGIYEFDLK